MRCLTEIVHLKTLLVRRASFFFGESGINSLIGLPFCSGDNSRIVTASIVVERIDGLKGHFG